MSQPGGHRDGGEAAGGGLNQVLGDHNERPARPRPVGCSELRQPKETAPLSSIATGPRSTADGARLVHAHRFTQNKHAAGQIRHGRTRAHVGKYSRHTHTHTRRG